MIAIEVVSERSYEVKVDCDWLAELLPELIQRAHVALVVSEKMSQSVRKLLPDQPNITLIEIQDGEDGKSIESLDFLWSQFADIGMTRNDLVIAVGGGATTDVAGFAASTWMRGIDWIAVPTTLAGMVDASVGGKTGMNSPLGKNLIGAFHSPISVLIDLHWLSTLSDRDFSAGMAEVIKCGFIASPKILEIVSGPSLQELRQSRDVTSQLIAESVRVKASVVSADFKESFTREILNYGHTLGHAVERDSNYQIRHGEAVSIGMVFVAELARARGLINDELVSEHKRILESFGLPITYEKSALPRLVKIMSLDKKNRGAGIRFVVLTGVGNTTRIDDVNDDEIFKAYERISV